MVLVVGLDKFVELRLGSVEGEAHVADAAGLALLHQELHHAVVYVALAEGRVAAASDGVHQVVVKVVRLQLVEGIPVHLLGCLRGCVVEVGQLGGNIIGVAGIAAEGYSGSLFALALEVCR